MRDVGGKGIAIIGGGATMAQAPIDDPAWVRWTLNDFYQTVPQRLGLLNLNLGALFEMHPISHYTKHREYIPDHEDKMAALAAKGLPIFLAFPNAKIPDAKIYPYDEIVAAFGRAYFCSTLAYMIPMAILQITESATRDDGAYAPRIGMFGCDMQLTSEYAKERACVEYWLGRAEQAGIELVVPDESPLMKSQYRYGYETEVINGRLALVKGRKQELAALLEMWEKAESQARGTAAEYRGMLAETGWAEQNFTDVRPENRPQVVP